MFQDLEIQASEMMVVPVVAQVQKISLPTNASTIEDGIILAIQAYRATEVSKIPAGTANVVNASAFANTFLTLRNAESGKEDLHQIPLADLLRNSNSGVIERVKNFRVDISQSYIEIGAPSTLVVGEAFLFRFIIIPKGGIGCAE